MAAEVKLIHIFECNHAFQIDKEDPLQTPEHRLVLEEQRHLFSAKLAKILESKGNITIVCEETKHGEDTFALRLARAHSIYYLNIDMTLEQRNEAGIPNNYTSFPIEERAPFYRLREVFFVKQITDVCGLELDALVVCGKDHVEAMARMLKEGGFDVEIHRLTLIDGFDLNWDSI